jgi:hypothetical protein
MAKDDTKKFTIHIDGTEYKTDKESLTGSELKALAGVDQLYGIFLEGHGHDPDKQIGDNEGVTIKNGIHFYTVPPATFG